MKKLQLGKNGLTENFFNQLNNSFKDTENVRISLLKSATRNKEEAKKIGEELIAKLGKNFTFKLIGFTLCIKKWRKSRQ